MRKRVFLAVVLSLCVADFAGFAAPRGRTTNGATQQNTNAASAGTAVAARAGARQKVVNNAGAKTTSVAPATGGVAARAGKKQTVVNTGVKTSGSAGAGQPMAARAGATQKVINTGTKVASASENTTIPAECQTAFYGCMDSFCMLDNASGGRCQCNDRIVELDKVLEDILKLDEQSYIMATEGVERIQMGEAEDVIMARAKAAGEKAANNKIEENKKKVRTLDLSVFDNNIFDEVDDVFGGDAQQSLMDKKGTALYNETSKMCGAQIPAQCKNYASMLQMVYVQKIKSDCMAYENSLKQQKNQSQQKLQTAQKALRDAALEEYNNQNKYATTGECAVAFAQCMQTTAECGEDYTGCVTMAARENVANNKAGSKAKQTTIKGAVAGADITLAASTMEQLLAKKPICERVTKQCVNSNKKDAVWNVFLRNAAPALKSAELIAEQDLRSNCIPSAVDCFKKACKSQFGDGESYDMCLSNPETYKSLCKVQLEPCLAATGGSYSNPEQSTLWNGLKAALGALKVDACTKEVKDCLTERCGEDYSGCIGLDTETIGNLCPSEKLTACMKDYNVDSVKDYVAKIAQGLAVQIDSALANVCQNAANEAMIKVCGDTETCESAKLDLDSLKSFMKVQACAGSSCYNSAAEISRANDVNGLSVKLVGEPNVGAITISDDGKFELRGKLAADKVTNLTVAMSDVSISKDVVNASTNELLKILNSALDGMIGAIETDAKVTYCREGREVQGFKASEVLDNKTVGQGARFPHLTDSLRGVIAVDLRNKMYEKYDALVSEYTEQITAMENAATERKVASGGASSIDEENRVICEAKSKKDPMWMSEGNCGNYTKGLACKGVRKLTDKEAKYDGNTNKCTVKTIVYKCQGVGKCKSTKVDEENSEDIHMAKD